MRTVMEKLKKNRGGFSLAETLIAILILLMVSAIVGGAIPTASTVYKKTVDAANAQILLSTTLTELRDELSTASNIAVDGTSITYRNGSGQWKIVLVPKGTTITIGSGDDATEKTVTPGIWLCRATAFDPKTGVATYPDITDFDTAAGTRLLVSEKAATENMAVSYSRISTELDSDNNVIRVTFNTITVGKTSDTNSLAERTAFTVRVVA